MADDGHIKDSSVQDTLADIEKQILEDRERLKSEFDARWAEDFAATGPILADMQRLVNLNDEFATVRPDVLNLLVVVKKIQEAQLETVSALESLAALMDELRRIRPRNLSDRLRAYIEDNDPSMEIIKALRFKTGAELKVLLDAAARMRHRHGHHHVHLSDDATEALHRRGGKDPNEISLKDLFE